MILRQSLIYCRWYYVKV